MAKLKTYHVELPRKEVDVYEVQACNKAEALAKARELRENGADEMDTDEMGGNIGVWSGSCISVYVPRTHAPKKRYRK